MKLFWHNYNPWIQYEGSKAIYLPNLKELSACLRPTDPEKHLNNWREWHKLEVDAYVIPSIMNDGYHSVGIRYGKEPNEYYSPYVNPYISSLLIAKYARTDFVQPDEDKYKFYHCYHCGMYHPVPWIGSCDSEIAAYNATFLDGRYGHGGWRLVPNPYHRLENATCALEQ